THPKFIRLFNRLLAALWRTPPVVSNPLWSRTRAETLAVLKPKRLRSLVSETNSCVHTRLMVAGKKHCGVCSQCVDRRFATIAVGLQKEDPSSGYVIDIFRDAVKEGHDRTMVLSYHGF